jgi:hypothetical protein
MPKAWSNFRWIPLARLDKARTLARVTFQFRDIRAKAATDTGDLAHSQKLLAHKNRGMTEHYVKARMGETGHFSVCVFLLSA